MGDRREVAQGGGPGVVAPIGQGEGTQLFSRLVLVIEVGTEGGDISAVTPDTPRVPLPMVLVDQGSQLSFDLAMIVHILAELHPLEGSD